MPVFVHQNVIVKVMDAVDGGGHVLQHIALDESLHSRTGPAGFCGALPRSIGTPGFEMGGGGGYVTGCGVGAGAGFCSDIELAPEKTTEIVMTITMCINVEVYAT